MVSISKRVLVIELVAIFNYHTWKNLANTYRTMNPEIYNFVSYFLTQRYHVYAWSFLVKSNPLSPLQFVPTARWSAIYCVETQRLDKQRWSLMSFGSSGTQEIQRMKFLIKGEEPGANHLHNSTVTEVVLKCNHCCNGRGSSWDCLFPFVCYRISSIL